MIKNSLLKPKRHEHYFDLTNGGKITVDLSREQSAVALKVHDYGVDSLDDDEIQILSSVIAAIKNEVHP